MSNKIMIEQILEALWKHSPENRTIVYQTVLNLISNHVTQVTKGDKS